MATVETLLAAHTSLYKLSTGKIRCSLTGHEMPARVEAIDAYVKGQKYIKAKNWYSSDFSKYEPYIVQHRKHEKKLYCQLTGEELNKIPEEVEAHVACGRYQRALAEVKAKEERDERRAKGELVEDSDEEDADEDEDMEEEEEEEAQPAKARGGKPSAGAGASSGASSSAAQVTGAKRARAEESAGAGASSSHAGGAKDKKKDKGKEQGASSTHAYSGGAGSSANYHGKKGRKGE